MTYVCTVRVASANLLVRIDLEGSQALYDFWYGNGEVYPTTSEVVDDRDALKQLISGLVWSEFQGSVDVVQAGTLGDDDLISCLAELRPILEFGYSQTPEALQ